MRRRRLPRNVVPFPPIPFDRWMKGRTDGGKATVVILPVIRTEARARTGRFIKRKTTDGQK